MDPTRFDRLATRLAARRPRRSALAAAGAVAGALALGTPTRRIAAQDATPAASPAANTSTLAHTDADLLFVQVASAATWTPKADADGTYTLTLTHQDGQTIYFSDRPERIVGTAPTQAFLDGLGFTPANPPNAAIVAGEEVLVVELLNPAYDAAAGTLTYDAVPLAQEDASAGLSHLANRQANQELPADLGPTSLFIDSAQATCSQYTDCWYVGGEGPGCTPISGTDSWSCPAGGIPNGPIDSCWDWGAVSCEPCDDTITKDALAASCNDAYSVCNGDCAVYVGY